MRRAPLLVASVGLGLVALLAAAWLTRPARVQTAQRNALERPTESLNRASDALVATASEPAQPAQESGRELIVENPLPTPSAVPTPSDLHGKLVLIDLDGTEQSDAYGSLTWTRWIGVTPQYYQVPVVNGEWVIGADSLQDLRALSFKDLQLGVQRATIEAPRGLHRPPFDEEFVVRARLIPSPSLRVVDAATGVDIEGITLVSANEMRRGVCHPGIGFESSLIASALSSPIYLEEPLYPRRRFGIRGAETILVGAAGFAWTRIEIEAKQDGEQLIELQRGADLALDVRGFDQASHAWLQLRKGNEDRGRLFCEAGLRSNGLLHINGLPSGPLRIVALVGSDASVIELGRVELELRAGNVTEGTLELSAAPPLVLADASGVLLVPEAWELKHPSLRWTLLDAPLGGFKLTHTAQLASVPSALADFDAFSWRMSALQAGNYAVEVEQLEHVMDLQVPPVGCAGLELVVPPPAEVLVHVVDDATGLPVREARLVWGHPSRFEFVTVTRDGVTNASGSLQIRAPAGEIEVTVFAPEYRYLWEAIDLRAGQPEITLRLEKSCGFDLRLICDGKVIEAPREVLIHVARMVQAETVGTVSSMESDVLGPKCSFELREPGTYSFTLPEMAGYEPVGTQTVAVQLGAYSQLAVELTRKR